MANESDLEIGEDDIKDEVDVTKENPSLMCEECPSVLKDKKAMSRHRKQFHDIAICSECGLFDHFNAKNLRPK